MVQMNHKNIDQGWAYVVLTSSFFINVICYGIAWSTGVYTGIFLDVFHHPNSVTAWVVSSPAAIMYVTGPVASVLTNKYGFRPVIIVGAGLVSGGLCLCYFAHNLFVILFAFGVITGQLGPAFGTGLALVYIPAMAALSCYFDKRITLAAGISTSGVGVGILIYPPLIRWLINAYDWKQSFLILGAVSLNMCALGLLIRPVKSNEINQNQPLLDLSPFKKLGYIMVCVSIFLYCCGLSVLFIHVAYGEQMGIDPDKSALLISGLGIANLLGHLGYGAVAQHPRVNTFNLYSVSFFFVWRLYLPRSSI
ncbi:monocarboxylate transporter 13-like [Mercenaria mercenaria]|uniref:monocarboxylate transporter 13-like n=1 Tax=Mercenaria mercenaria TaxID=6596 RepID=UPI00234F8EEE|nr:monocarboxylate transporter 13-like [Mercenaria mercenaria]